MLWWQHVLVYYVWRRVCVGVVWEHEHRRRRASSWSDPGRLSAQLYQHGLLCRHRHWSQPALGVLLADDPPSGRRTDAAVQRRDALHPDQKTRLSVRGWGRSTAWLNGLAVSARGVRARWPRGFDFRVVPLSHWVATLGKLFTLPRSKKLGTKGIFRRLEWLWWLSALD